MRQIEDLENKWWHRLSKIGLWIPSSVIFLIGLALIYEDLAIREFDAEHLIATLLLASLSFIISWTLYHKFLLYVLYGKDFINQISFLKSRSIKICLILFFVSLVARITAPIIESRYLESKIREEFEPQAKKNIYAGVLGEKRFSGEELWEIKKANENNNFTGLPNETRLKLYSLNSLGLCLDMATCSLEHFILLFTDLNADNLSDLIVDDTTPKNCGSGGCTYTIGVNIGDRLVNGGHIFGPSLEPIDEYSNGFKNLKLTERDYIQQGIAYKTRIIIWDGNQYNDQ